MTEGMGEGGDETDGLSRLWNAEQGGGRGGIFQRERFQGKSGPDSLLNFLLGEKRISRVGGDGHLFDKPERDTPCGGEGEEGKDLIEGFAHGDGVDLQGDAQGERGVDPGKDHLQTVHSGQFAERGAIEGVQADVDSLNRGLLESGSGLLQEVAVGCHVEGGEERGGLDKEGKDPFSNQRFTAGDPHLSDPPGGKEGEKVENILVAEDSLVGDEREGFVGVAVTATEGTTVGDGDTNIV